MIRAFLLASVAALSLAATAAAAAPPFATPAPVAYLIDLSSGAVLLPRMPTAACRRRRWPR